MPDLFDLYAGIENILVARVRRMMRDRGLLKEPIVHRFKLPRLSDPSVFVQVSMRDLGAVDGVRDAYLSEYTIAAPGHSYIVRSWYDLATVPVDHCHARVLADGAVLARHDLDLRGLYVIDEAPLSVADWLRERHANCLRIAKTKTGRDRDDWLEDAHYFAAAIEIIEGPECLSEARVWCGSIPPR